MKEGEQVKVGEKTRKKQGLSRNGVKKEEKEVKYQQIFCVTEAYPNPRSNKKSKGQHYREFQLHIDVSCIL